MNTAKRQLRPLLIVPVAISTAQDRQQHPGLINKKSAISNKSTWHFSFISPASISAGEHTSPPWRSAFGISREPLARYPGAYALIALASR